MCLSILLFRLEANTLESQIYNTKTAHVIRWATFLPIAIMSSYLAFIVVNILNNFSLLFVSINSDAFFYKVYLEWVSNIAMGAAFIYVGAKIVPKYKKEVSFCLAIVGLVVMGAMMYSSIMSKAYWSVWAGTCFIIGLSTTAYMISVERIEI